MTLVRYDANQYYRVADVTGHKTCYVSKYKSRIELTARQLKERTGLTHVVIVSHLRRDDIIL